jgi:outer membrane protein assembly factor BamB
MVRYVLIAFAFAVSSSALRADDWPQFRGPTGQGISNEKNLPVKWSATENIAWKLKLPGAGASSPITLGKRVFVTCYSGYGLDEKTPGEMKDLNRHLVCIDRTAGKILWSKEFPSLVSEHKYSGEGAYHGYAANTPITDGEKVYVFFGKAGVFCFDLDGQQLWHVVLGKGQSGWGSGASPILYKNLLVVNASIESQAIIALDKTNGKEVWKAPKISSSWGIPMLVTTPQKTQELAVSASGRVVGMDPETGKELWSAKGHGGYVVPSVVTHDGIVYAIGGGGTSLAIKAGGKEDVSESQVLWRKSKGSNASSPIYHDGFLYWINSNGSVLVRQDAATGATTERRISQERFLWSSPVLADGKLYIVSQHEGVYVIAANAKLDEIAHNVFADDKSRSNASIAISDGQLFLRNDQYLYCIGKR